MTSPIDPTAISPRGTFYLENGNMKVLCGNTLFRVHKSIPVLPLSRAPLTISTRRFPKRNKVPNFATFSSLLRITAKYELPAI